MSNLGNKEVFSKNLQHYMQKFHKERNQVCDDLGFKYSTFTEWVNGNKYPRIDKIEILANYFGIQKSDLIEDPATFSRSSDSHEIENPRIAMLLRISKDLDTKAQDKIADAMELAVKDIIAGK
jgi:hypothetical protein